VRRSSSSGAGLFRGRFCASGAVNPLTLNSSNYSSALFTKLFGSKQEKNKHKKLKKLKEQINSI